MLSWWLLGGVEVLILCRSASVVLRCTLRSYFPDWAMVVLVSMLVTVGWFRLFGRVSVCAPVVEVLRFLLRSMYV